MPKISEMTDDWNQIRQIITLATTAKQKSQREEILTVEVTCESWWNLSILNLDFRSVWNMSFLPEIQNLRIVHFWPSVVSYKDTLRLSLRDKPKELQVGLAEEFDKYDDWNRKHLQPRLSFFFLPYFVGLGLNLPTRADQTNGSGSRKRSRGVLIEV